MKHKVTLICNAVLMVCVALFSSCDKSSKVESKCIIVPRLQLVSGGDFLLGTADVKAYGFEVDDIENSEWIVESYEDAVNGRIFDEINNVEKTYDFIFSLNMEGYIEYSPIRHNKLVLVVYNTNNYSDHENEYNSRMYGWRTYDFFMELENAYLRVTFKPWERKEIYEETSWTMVNDNPYNPVTTSRIE